MQNLNKKRTEGVGGGGGGGEATKYNASYKAKFDRWERTEHVIPIPLDG